MSPRSCATRLRSSRFVGSGDSVTCGSVSVFTKSLFGSTCVGAGGITTTGGAVSTVGVGGCATTFFVVWHAAANTNVMTATPQKNTFHFLLMIIRPLLG